MVTFAVGSEEVNSMDKFKKTTSEESTVLLAVALAGYSPGQARRLLGKAAKRAKIDAVEMLGLDVDQKLLRR